MRGTARGVRILARDGPAVPLRRARADFTPWRSFARLVDKICSDPASKWLEAIQEGWEGVELCIAAVQAGEAAEAQDGEAQVRDEVEVMPFIQHREVGVW